MADNNPLLFEAPHSRFHPSFWESLYSNTLDTYRLTDWEQDYITLSVPYPVASTQDELSGFFQFDSTAFIPSTSPIDLSRLFGRLVVVNTIEVILIN